MQSDESEPEDSSSEASKGTSAETVESSNCDLHEPDTAPGVVASDLAAILATHDVIQVVTIPLNEAALAPAVLRLRLPYLERLLEAVRSGIASEGLVEALRPAAGLAVRQLPCFGPCTAGQKCV